MKTIDTYTGNCTDRDGNEHDFTLDRNEDGEFSLYLDGQDFSEADSIETLRSMESISASPAIPAEYLHGKCLGE